MLSIVIGSTVETYKNLLKFFDKVEKKFKCKVKKKNYYTYETTIKNEKVEFLFAFKPFKNKDYEKSVLKWKARGRKLPPPIEETVKKVRGNRVLFLSFYGAFTGKLNQVYLPISVTPKFIKKRNNKLEDFKNLKGKIEFDNLLVGKVKGKKSNHITTNTLFTQEKFEGGADGLVKLAKFLAKKYDSIDMELYVLVKALKDKLSIGAMGVSSDILDKKHLHMEYNVVKQDTKYHVESCLKAIEVMLD